MEQTPVALTIDNAATALQRNRATIYRMIKKGELRTVRYGGRQSVPMVEIDRLLGVE